MATNRRVSLDVIDTAYVLPKRYHAPMLKLLLNLRRLPQERYDAVVEAVSIRALERRLNDADVDELADLLSDPRADDALLDWFLSYPIATPFEVRKRLEHPGTVSGSAAHSP